MDRREAQERIKETVLEIMKDADINKMTLSMVRKAASEKLNMDLSEFAEKKLVQDVVDSFLMEQVAKAYQYKEDETENAAEEEVVEEEANREYDDYDGIIICNLTNYRRITVNKYKKKTLVSIREFFIQGGQEYYKTKGISLTCEQWTSLKKNIPKIDEAIKEMNSK